MDRQYAEAETYSYDVARDYPYAETGRRIFELRKDREMTREKLSELADISVQFLADIEKGRKSMTDTTLKKLSSALMTPTDYIVFGRDRSTSGIDPGLMELCMSLPPKRQKQASAILRVFFEAVDE